MSRLDEFLRLLCGRFDNTRQLEELRRSGSPALPLAEHVNTVCNDKIDGLPADFAGAFVLEESYYTTEGKTHASPHLFLFTETSFSNGSILSKILSFSFSNSLILWRKLLSPM